MQYSETVGDLKAKVAAATGVPVEHQQARSGREEAKRHEAAQPRSQPPPSPQLFWHSKELLSTLYDKITIDLMELHTGFGINGYDTRTPPDYWPPVFRTPKGLMEKAPITNPEYLERHPDAINDPETLVVVVGEPIKQDPAWLVTEQTPKLREVYMGMR